MHSLILPCPGRRADLPLWAPVSDFSLVESSGTITSNSQQERRFLDFVLDSKPTCPTVLANGGDNISPLWLGGGHEWCRTAIDRLLGEAEPDAPGGRVSVYVCAECADLGCGAITVLVERSDATVSWRNWGYQNNYDDWFVRLDDLPDVTFDAAQYALTLRAVLDRLHSR
ncbi:MAG: hypothetical protein FD127_1891 [Acidimicrobiaceae bacterium]|nr:MAG: hypothetical protein FD127_1891 [Acidimicrobiaceae bacterium]